jgi:hypothetical protein
MQFLQPQVLINTYVIVLDLLMLDVRSFLCTVLCTYHFVVNTVHCSVKIDQSDSKNKIKLN